MFLFLLSYLESVQTVVLCRFWLQSSRSLRNNAEAAVLLKGGLSGAAASSGRIQEAAKWILNLKKVIWGLKNFKLE